MRAGLVTADRGFVMVFPPTWRAELVLVAAEHADAVEQRFEELLGRQARRYAGRAWRFSKRRPLRLVGAAARRLSACQRISLAVVRLWRAVAFVSFSPQFAGPRIGGRIACA